MNKSLREINSRRLLRYNGQIVYLCFKMAYSLGKPREDLPRQLDIDPTNATK